MTKKSISWGMLCVGILCIYINMGVALNNSSVGSLLTLTKLDQQNREINNIKDEIFIIEDEIVPGGEVPISSVLEYSEVTFYIVAILMTGVGVTGVAKKRE